MAGGKASAAHYVGAIDVKSAQALDQFVRAAPPLAELVYCEAPEPQRSAGGWRRAGELAQDGLVNLFSRRRAGGGWQYYAVRTKKCLPRQQSPEQKVLDDRATAIIFTELKRAAGLGLRCPSDADLARKAGLNSRNQAAWRVRELIRVELIDSVQHYRAGVPTRVVTIKASKYAGSAAAKATVLA